MDISCPEKANSDKGITGFRRNKNLCFCLIAGLVGFIPVIVIMGFTVFKPKNTITTVNSVKLDGFHLSVDVPKLGVDLNQDFRYGNGSSLWYYKGDVVGEAGILAGKISPGETIGLNTILTVLVDRLISNSNVYSDSMSGILP
ncbi:hypothetical protein MKW94_006881, partial [Papaver nudicaule]|nr:hypothetical protein [Papaver nudicaule]